MNIEIVRPEYLALLGLVPVIIFLHFFMLKQKRSQALRFANFEAISRIRGVDLLSKNIIALFITLLIITLLVLSLSGLQVQRTLYSSSFSYIIAIDTSSSMDADDLPPNRLEVAKAAAKSFVENAPIGTKIGVISFSGNSYMEQALTQEKDFLIEAIEKIPLSSIGGTDIGESIVTSTNLLEGEEAKSAIILSDGRINIGSLENSITYANNNNVIVHTIGIGTEEGGKTSYGLSKIDENALKAVAHNTNGKYFKAESLDEISKSFGEVMDLKFKKVTTDATPYLIIATLFLFTLQYILINTRFKVIP